MVSVTFYSRPFLFVWGPSFSLPLFSPRAQTSMRTFMRATRPGLGVPSKWILMMMVRVVVMADLLFCLLWLAHHVAYDPPWPAVARHSLVEHRWSLTITAHGRQAKTEKECDTSIPVQRHGGLPSWTAGERLLYRLFLTLSPLRLRILLKRWTFSCNCSRRCINTLLQTSD